VYTNDIIQTTVFLVVLLLLGQILDLPWKIYSTYVIEEKYGFNKTTPGTFVKDEVKTYFLSMILSAAAISVLLYIIEKAGNYMVLSLAGASIGLVVLINLLVPTVILPLFFTLSELDEGDLKTAIFKEAEKTEIPVSQIKVIDGSQRSSHSNAFVTGFGAFRKVVLFDTLIEQHTPEQILAIVNHELGHVAHYHILKSVAATSIQLIVMFFVFQQCLENSDILLSFGFTQKSNFIILFLFQALYMPVGFFTKFLTMYMSRKAEYEADAFAVKYQHGTHLKSGLIDLFKRNKGALSADPLYSAYNHSHPTLIERLLAVDSLEKKK